jgi:hypothetical protein
MSTKHSTEELDSEKVVSVSDDLAGLSPVALSTLASMPAAPKLPGRSISVPKKSVVIPEDAKFKSYLELYFKTHSENVFVESKLAPVDGKKIQIRTQICFVMDATGSMAEYIAGTKKEICKFIETLRSDSQKDFESKFVEEKEKFEQVFEVAVIAYRDFTDRVHFETHDFTTDIKLIENFLGTIRADGGGDDPEDVKGAFIHALFGFNIGDGLKSLSWENHGEVANRTIMWLADAPPHGKLFYNKPAGDSYPTDDNEWDVIFDRMKELYASLFVIRLNDKNDAAYDAFKQLNTYTDSDGKTQKKIPLDQIDVSQAVKSAHSSGYSGSMASAGGMEKMAMPVPKALATLSDLKPASLSAFDSGMAYTTLERAVSSTVSSAGEAYVKRYTASGKTASLPVAEKINEEVEESSDGAESVSTKEYGI